MRDLARIYTKKLTKIKRRWVVARKVLCVPNDRKTPKIRINTRHVRQIASQNRRCRYCRGSRPRHTRRTFCSRLGRSGLGQKPQLCYSKLTSTIVLFPRGAQMRSAATLKVTEEHVAEPNREDLQDLRVVQSILLDVATSMTRFLLLLYLRAMVSKEKKKLKLAFTSRT